MGALENLAAKFVVSPPPADYAGRLQFLAQHLQYVEQIVAALPEPETFSDSEVLGDLRSLKDTITSVAPLLTPTSAVASTGKQMRNVIIGLWNIVSYGARVHSPDWRQAVLTQKIMTAKELDDDYMARLGTLQAIMAVANSGILDPLFSQKPNVPTSGLGVLDPATLVVIVTIAAVVLAAIAAALVYWSLLASTNKKLLDRADKLCFDANGNPIPAVQADCVALLNGIQKSTATASPTDLLNQVLKYAAIGGAIYVAIVFLPDIVRSLRGTKAAMKEPV